MVPNSQIIMPLCILAPREGAKVVLDSGAGKSILAELTLQALTYRSLSWPCLQVNGLHIGSAHRCGVALLEVEK